jgi:2-polyprenyl-3-methyl-5-hydroxy-6-metoxy-1,4-benzoquinol methylase
MSKSSTKDRSNATPEALDMEKVEHFLHSVVGDLGAAMSAILIHIGDRLGLYRALGDSRPVTPADLAQRCGLAERYVREWLHNQAAAGWVTYEPAAGTFTLPAEHALLVSDETAPTFLLGGFDFVASAWADEDTTTNAFRTGEGIGWHQHDHRLFTGTERFFRPGYQANLVDAWLPALDGVVDQLRTGAKVADVGCGHGATTILLGESFPKSTITGFDYHDASIAMARTRAGDAGVTDRVTFEVAGAKDYAGKYDLVCLFDCLHDMGDPVGVAQHMRKAISDDGTWMIVEPLAGDRVEDNFNPVGRLFYCASVLLCTSGAIAQEGQMVLGGQAGEARIHEVVTAGGFTRFRRAAQTPINLVFEARP